MGRKTWIAVGFLALLIPGAYPGPAQGASWKPIPFERAVQDADLVVEATVSDIASYFEKGEFSPESGERNLIRSNVTLTLDGPESVWKGIERVGEKRQIVINTVGGRVGDIRLVNTAMHDFAVGDRLVLLLKAIQPGEEFKEGAEYKIPSGLMDTFLVVGDDSVRSVRFAEEEAGTPVTLPELRLKIEVALAASAPY